MSQVKKFMTKNVKTIGKDAQVCAAAKKMIKEKIGTLIVLSKRKIVGIVTERDIVQKVCAKGIASVKVKVEDIMTDNIVIADEGITDIKAGMIMTKNKIKKLPLTKNGELSGIITQTDIMKYISEKW